MYRPLAEKHPPRQAGPTGIHAGVVQGIGRRIVRGELATGEILPEQGELSRMLGVSRTVVREALKSLALAGLIESRHGDGTYVADSTPEQEYEETWHKAEGMLRALE